MANSMKRAAAALALAAGAGALTGCATTGQMGNPLNTLQNAAHSVAGGLVPSAAPGAAQASHQTYNNPNLQVDSRGVLFEVTSSGQPVLVQPRTPQACAAAVSAQRRDLAIQNQGAAADRYNANRTGAVVDSTGRRAAGAVEYGVRSGNTQAATRGVTAAAAGGVTQIVTGIFSNAIRSQGVENTQDRSAAQLAELKQDCLQQAAQTCGSNGACFTRMTTTGYAPR